MDRQQLLQQKRQRLKELQERRKVSLKVEEVRKLDVSTQTNVEIKPVIVPKELNTYDKGVQTVQIEETKVTPVKQDTKYVNVQEISQSKLNSAIISSIKLVNKFKKLHEIELTKSQIETTKLDKQQVDIGGRLVIYKQYLAVISDYKVVVYDRITYLPQHHLISTTPISNVTFDIYKERVIGILQHGKICIWELNDKLKTLPVLISPNINPIFIKQLKVNENEVILTVSKSAIEIWSANILQSPRRRIPCDRTITNAVYIGDDAIVGEEKYNLYLISGGKIYQNEELIHESDSAIYSVVKFKDILITCHSDWTLKLWKDSLYKCIPTTNLITKIIPNGDLKFVTIGHLSKYVVELWDLNKRLYAPIMKIDEFDQIISVTYNENVIISTPEKHIIYSLDDLKIEKCEFDKGLI